MDSRNSESQATVLSIMDIGYSFVSIGPIRRGRKLGPTSSRRLGLVRLVEDFCADVEKLNMKESLNLAGTLRSKHLKKLQKKLYEDPTAVLYLRTAQDLKAAVHALWDQVQSEASDLSVYVVKPSRFGLFKKFTQSPRGTLGLAEEYEPTLPKELNENLEEARRCLSVGFVVDGTFFVLRATEVVLKFLHSLVCPEEKHEQSWGMLYRDLKARGCAAPTHVVMAIESLTEDYRNPFFHVINPDLRLDEDTTFDVLSRCADVIEQIMEYLEASGKVSQRTRLLASSDIA